MVVLTFLGAGKYSDVFRVTDPGSRGKSVVMKLSYYRDATICNLVDKLRNRKGAEFVRDSISVSQSFGEVTNDLMARGVSPHFVTILCEADCGNLMKRLATALEPVRARLQTSSKLQMRYNHVCFMELFHWDMTKWLRKRRPTDAEVRTGIFQVLYTLAALQKLYPGFRHNDLSTNNVLVKKVSNVAGNYVLPGGTTFVVRNMGYLVALNDYDFTHVPGIKELENERILSRKYKVSAGSNPSYDTHFFLKSVWKTTTSKPAREFLKSLPLREEDRLEDYVNNNPREGIKGVVVAGLEPVTVLQHPYFDSLRGKAAGLPTYSF